MDKVAFLRKAINKQRMEKIAMSAAKLTSFARQRAIQAARVSTAKGMATGKGVSKDLASGAPVKTLLEQRRAINTARAKSRVIEGVHGKAGMSVPHNANQIRQVAKNVSTHARSVGPETRKVPLNRQSAQTPPQTPMNRKKVPWKPLLGVAGGSALLGGGYVSGQRNSNAGM